MIKAAVVGNARSILIAEELDVAAERNGTDLPARPAFVGIAEQFGAETDGEGEDADTGPAPDKVVAHLVHEDDQRQNQQKRHDIAENKVKHIGQVSHVIPRSGMRRQLRPQQDCPHGSVLSTGSHDLHQNK